MRGLAGRRIFRRSSTSFRVIQRLSNPTEKPGRLRRNLRRLLLGLNSFETDVSLNTDVFARCRSNTMFRSRLIVRSIAK